MDHGRQRRHIASTWRGRGEYGGVCAARSGCAGQVKGMGMEQDDGEDENIKI